MNHVELLPLYREPLIELSHEGNNGFKKLGQFKQKVLAIVLTKEWNSSNEDFIKKIFMSCGLNDKDYLIVLVDALDQVFGVINENSPEILFLIGINFESEIFTGNKKKYKPFNFNKIKIVLTDSLNDLQADKAKRLLLWNDCIKPLFNIH